MKTITKIILVSALILDLTSCGETKKEWETMADEYCGCIGKAAEIKNSDPGKYVEEFKKCQDITAAHQAKLTDPNDANDYRKKINGCLTEAYKK